ncbi:microcystin dependent MdpB family protein [Tateyamaria omphalii]|uniref:phage tail protein n=1 Tax=Tateyamaria omphalii TaxID=299262 RepID=UPI0016725E2C|nr:tail fiber protein [Tateyamaria omphalii]GGX70515.1 microcystin dependent MdpB family protein [Tateyamaria omphalii]
MSDAYIAQIMMFGGNFAPRAWAFCDGQLLAISSNTALFSIIGTTYGGDGRTTFALPDLRGRVAMHPGHGPGLTSRSLGQRGGVENVTLNTTQIPSHNHFPSATATTNTTSQMRAESRAGNVSTPAGNMLAGGTNIFRANAPAEDVVMDPAMVDVQVDVNVAVTEQNVGGNLSHTNVQPFQCVNYIICLFGIFPSRS